MGIFNDKNVRLQVIITVIILMVLILMSQFTIFKMVDDYKKVMISHDNAVAGYLSNNGVDNIKIVQAFIEQKTDDDIVSGSTLLSNSGYKESIKSSLLPEIEQFYQKYACLVLVITVGVSLTLLAGLLKFAWKRDKQLEEAEEKIHLFMDGNIDIRLEDNAEGNISRLFATVNEMATSLTTHINKEKQSGVLLKDTIADISHQLKTPLAALQMYNEIIIAENTRNKVVEDFTIKVARELTHIENLIQSLLKLAKLDAGAIELDKRVYKMKDFLEECKNGFITRAKLEDKTICLQCEKNTLFCFDKIWLGEAVNNIVKNALDHTMSGNQIEISCEETIIATEIIVKDNGSGIHPDDIPHIFKRFYRSRYSQNPQGVGIGLALTKAIIERHGGTITVKSKLGNGSSFDLLFPKLSNM